MIQCRLKVLLAERKIARTPPYTQADLAQVTGLGRSTVDNLANNKTHRYDAHVLDGICTTLGCKIGELLVHVPDEPEAWGPRRPLGSALTACRDILLPNTQPQLCTRPRNLPLRCCKTVTP